MIMYGGADCTKCHGPAGTWQTLNRGFFIITLGQDPEQSLEAPLRKPSHFPCLCLAKTHFIS